MSYRPGKCRPPQGSRRTPGGRLRAQGSQRQGDSWRGTPCPSEAGPAAALTEARGGDGVHVDLVVADFLMALPVGGWLREGGALVAMAPGDLVHALHHAGLQALPARRGALPETGTAELRASLGRGDRARDPAPRLSSRVMAITTRQEVSAVHQLPEGRRLRGGMD